MNYLQLAQRLAVECGVAGGGPASVLGQTGMYQKLVNWTNDAWVEIQGMHDNWNWMREPFTFETVASTGDYLPATVTNTVTSTLMTDLRYWWKDTFRCQKKSIGVQDEQWLVEWEYQVFRNTYRFNVQVNGRPVVFAIKPNGKAVMLGQIPDDVYLISGEYQVLPTSMTADADVPAMPEHLHLAIVYKAMQFYGLFEAAPEVLSKGNTEFSRLMNQLEREQLPELYLGNPLA
jgi:hypothetical protein